jgi:hypothetical protein
MLSAQSLPTPSNAQPLPRGNGLARHLPLLIFASHERQAESEGRQLDPPLALRDMGLALLTGQWRSDGPALGAPTCWLCGQVHSAWSQSGPQAFAWSFAAGLLGFIGVRTPEMD